MRGAADNAYNSGAYLNNRAATSVLYSSEGGATASDVRDFQSLRDEMNSDSGMP